MSYRRTLVFLLLLVAGVALAACDSDSTQLLDKEDVRPEQVAYDVTLLPSLGSTTSAGNGINNRGWVVGGSNHPGNQTSEAALWKGETVIPLGTLGGTIVTCCGVARREQPRNGRGGHRDRGDKPAQ